MTIANHHQTELYQVRQMGLPAVWEVGGCLRDELAGEAPKDLDLMVAGVTPEELLQICQQHGKAESLEVAGQLVGVRLHADWTGAEGIELALARQEISTGPGHTDFAIAPFVLPSDMLELPVQQREENALWQKWARQDLARRDFTCNAIARDITTGEIVDPFGGVGDIKKGLLRMTSPDTFRDDPLRILRGLARVSKDGMRFERSTASSARQYSKGFRMGTAPGELSPERVQAEMDKILSGCNSRQAFQLMIDWGLVEKILPEWQPSVGFESHSRYHDLTVDQHVLKALEYADSQGYSLDVKWAVLMHDIGKPGTAKPNKHGGFSYFRAPADDPVWQTDPERGPAHEELGKDLTMQALDRLRFTNQRKQNIAQLVRHHMFREEREFSERSPAKQERLARRMLSRHGTQRCNQLLEIRRCDLAGKSDKAPEPGWDRDCNRLQTVLQEQSSQPFRLKDLNVNGQQLIEMGLPAGPRVGEALGELLRLVVDDPDCNDPARIETISQRLVERMTGSKR